MIQKGRKKSIRNNLLPHEAAHAPCSDLLAHLKQNSHHPQVVTIEVKYCFIHVMYRLVYLLFLLPLASFSQQGFEMEPLPVKQKDTTKHFVSEGAVVIAYRQYSKPLTFYRPPMYPGIEVYHAGFHFKEKLWPTIGYSYALISKKGFAFKGGVGYFNYSSIEESNIDSINKYIPDSLNTFLLHIRNSNTIGLGLGIGYTRMRMRGFIGLRLSLFGFPSRYNEDKYGTVTKSTFFVLGGEVYPTFRLYYILNYFKRVQFPVFVGATGYTGSRYGLQVGTEIRINKE